MKLLELVRDSHRLTSEPLSDPVARQAVAELSAAVSGEVYPTSVAVTGRSLFALARLGAAKRLAILSLAAPAAAGFRGETQTVAADGDSAQLALCRLTLENAAALRSVFAWLQPRPLGLHATVGCGDRLGLATPGQLRAVRACRGAMAPILAQQSIREMTRTDRSPQQVIDDAMWGVFQEGWREGYGADADHLKTDEDIDRCAAAGFCFYTFDPGAHVDSQPEIRAVDKFEGLPWADLRTTPADVLRRYARPFDLPGCSLAISEADARLALVKYGRAVAHIARLYWHLAETMSGRAFEVEISVDETDLPTSHAEHFIVAGELRRLGVEWVSLAPRFVGRFEKGVDYIGDAVAFQNDFEGHVAVAQHWGPYKLSIHSGSDKFSLYPIVARMGRGLVHLKTAGTSYLEALRTVAACEPALFRRVYALARERYAFDRASYHVSAEVARAPAADRMADGDLAALLDQFDARQMMHVCFGSILAVHGAEIRAVLAAHEETHYSNLARHIGRHLSDFCALTP